MIEAQEPVRTVEFDLQTGFGATSWGGIGGGIASGCCCWWGALLRTGYRLDMMTVVVTPLMTGDWIPRLKDTSPQRPC